MKIFIQTLLIGSLAIGGNVAIAEDRDPFADPNDKVSHEAKPRPVTAEGKRTLEILQTEKFDTIELKPENPKEGFELLKNKLAKLGVTVRLKNYGREDPQERSGGPLALRDIPLDKFMQYFDQWAGWGWILYPDGSITYFDSQCACSWPKNGLHCHNDQYEAGKPEVMASERKTDNKPGAEQGGGAKPAKPGGSP